MSKKKGILFLDTDLNLSHALALGREGEKVYYHCSGGLSAYPTLENSITGYGFDEIIKTEDWSAVIKDCDTVIFGDSGYSSLVNTIREGGYNVFGAPAVVEAIEFDRVYFREAMKKIGVATTEATVVHGVDAVIEFLKKNKSKFYIKLNKYRGSVETFGTDSVAEAVTLLYPAFPVMADELDFIIEPEVEDAIEIGADAFFNGEKFLKKYFFTCEKKGAGTMGVVVETSVLDDFMQKITPYLKEHKYFGAFAFEGFWNGKEFTLSDPCPRIPNPCSASWILAIKEYGKFMRGVAAGTIDDFEVRHAYQVQFAAFADDSKRWRKMEIDEEKLDGEYKSIEFRKAIKIDGEYFYVPADDLMASICGAGDSWEEAMKNAVDASDCIKAYCSGADTSAQLYFKDALEIMKKYGVELTPVTIQKEEASLEQKLEQIEAKQAKFLFCKSCKSLVGNTSEVYPFICPVCKEKISEDGTVVQPLIPHPKEEKHTIQ